MQDAKNKIKYLLFFFSFLPVIAKAQGLGDASKNLQDVGGQAFGSASSNDLPTIVGSIINISLTLIGMIFVILLVYSGFIWMTAAGNEEKVSKAKDTIRRSIIGIIIIVASYAIADFVITNLTGITGTTTP